MRNSSPKRSSTLVLTQDSASSFSTGDASERNTFVHPNATFSPNDCMIEARSSSFEPINRYTVPVPSPAAEAMSLMVVTS